MDLVVAAYLVLLVVLGLRFSRRQTSTEKHFIAMLATMISSVTFLAYPGSSYTGNWSLLVPGLLIVANLPLVAKVVIPF